jgi:hypothetical protein
MDDVKEEGREGPGRGKASSDAKTMAARANGAKGGPKTAAGRAAVSMNAVKLGLTMETGNLLPDEDLAEFARMKDETFAAWEPWDAESGFLVGRLVDLKQRLLRASKAEQQNFLRSEISMRALDYERQRLFYREDGHRKPISKDSPEVFVLEQVKDAKLISKASKMSRVEKNSLMLGIALGRVELQTETGHECNNLEPSLGQRVRIQAEEAEARFAACMHVLHGSSTLLAKTIEDDDQGVNDQISRYETALLNSYMKVTAVLMKLKENHLQRKTINVAGNGDQKEKD